MIPVRVKLFAVLREQVGRDEFEIELPEGTSRARVPAILEAAYRELAPVWRKCLIAVNGRCGSADTVLAAGDVLGILPPVSGG